MKTLLSAKYFLIFRWRESVSEISGISKTGKNSENSVSQISERL